MPSGILSRDRARLYNKDLNLQFYHIPKNAMTSTIRGLKLKWVSAEQIQDFFEGRRTLAILRDPLKRFVSSFNYILYLQNPHTSDFSSAIRRPPSSYLESAEAYLIELENNGFSDSHNLPQCWWLDEKYIEDLFKIEAPTEKVKQKLVGHANRVRGRTISQITHFARFESLNEDLSLLAPNYTIPRLNKGRKLRKAGPEKFAQKNRARIEALYRDDVELYKKFILDK